MRKSKAARSVIAVWNRDSCMWDELVAYNAREREVDINA